MKANKPEKRKDIMTNIKRRLELGTYSVSDVIRNQRDVLDKIKHYERNSTKRLPSWFPVLNLMVTSVHIRQTSALDFTKVPTGMYGPISTV